MDVKKTLYPGDMGTKRLLKKYGEQLICVRYRIDKLSKERLTTVELIVDKKPYLNLSPSIRVWVKIKFNEAALREQVKAHNAKWLNDEKVWEMKYETAKKLRLKKRIVKRITNANG